ncbi:MAG: 3-methylcrotonyl-CoA carboxylase [Gammaproteobacteria bacterium]|nr:3-methylcrotonyl-CoA carboxylase [Gammaproteobacteria bacterium]
MFERLLIANRGEIAARIARTAKRLGIRTVGVCSSIERQAYHARAMDEVRVIGGPLPAESYLNIDAIIEAARDTGCTAVHPGYGFLSENPEFAERCAGAGLILVGPPAEAMRAMAIKGDARDTMAAAGVPVLPGIPGLASLSDAVRADIEAVGYPLLLKPESGGGGKGMHVVHADNELEELFAVAQREASASFGDATILIERYLAGPRHVEVQVFADNHGGCVWVGERDCSLQRRHQKIIEEAPAPHIREELRDALGSAAVDAARAIGYRGAGTVEFLLDADGRFYFMEMNTRLQVEHPVTEAVTGLDLVEWQLRVASGEPLPLAQNEITRSGHAVEARIYAENPSAGFLPDSGTISYLLVPSGDGIRVDNGVARGDAVGVFYDPMLMKVIASGSDRDAALATLERALGGLHVAGLETNRDFLLAMLRRTAVRDGTVTTDYLDTHGFGRAEIVEDRTLATITAVCWLLHDNPAPAFRLNQPHTARIRLYDGEDPVDARVLRRSDALEITVDGATHRVSDAGPSSAVIDGTLHRFSIIEDGDELHVFLSGATRTFARQRQYSGSADSEAGVAAPMSGRIIRIEAESGSVVAEGTPLVVIEAMKMEHTIRAPSDGTVVSLRCSEGDLVDEGIELVEFEASE